MIHGTVVFVDGHVAVRARTGVTYSGPNAEYYTFKGSYFGARSDYECMAHSVKLGDKLVCHARPSELFREGTLRWYREGAMEHVLVTRRQPTSPDAELEPVPPPKVRRGIQVRWSGYGWEKLLKSGWVVA